MDICTPLRRTAAVLFFIGIAYFSAAAGFQFYPQAGDLPSLSVSAIAQDSRGFMWFGTRGSGVIRFARNSYTAYTYLPFEENSIAASQIQSMFMDKDDILWIGTTAGLSRLDTKTGAIVNYGVCGDIVCCFLRDSKGRLWVGTLTGLCILNETDGSFVTFSASESERHLPNDTVRGLYEDSRGRVFACTYDGVFQLDEPSQSFKRADFLTPDNPAASGTVYSLEEDPNGYYWASSWGNGLVRINAATKEFTLFPLPDNHIYCMSADFQQGLIIAGTWGGGLYTLETATGATGSYTTSTPPPGKLPNNTIFSLFQDANGLLWIGTHGGGIVTYDKTRSWFNTISAGSATVLNTANIQHLNIEFPDKLWAAIKNSGIACYNRKENTVREYNKANGGISTDITFFVYTVADKKVYAGTDSGLYVYNPQSDRFETADWYKPFMEDKANHITYSFFEDADGIFWIGLYNGGLIRYNPATAQYKHYQANGQSGGLTDNLVYFITSDSKANIWIGTNNGLNKYNPQTDSFETWRHNPRDRQSIAGNTIISLYEAADGKLWVGTNGGGAAVFSPDTQLFDNMSTADGLPSNCVVGFFEAGDGAMWVTTNNGLGRYDPVSAKTAVYKVSDGLLSDQFTSQPVAFPDGMMFFPSSRGIFYFDYKMNVGDFQHNFQILINDLSINGVKTTPEEFAEAQNRVLKLHHTKNNFFIGFTALDYSPLAKPLYEYKLDGFDEEWIYAGSRESVQYTNLKPGSYVFRVKNYNPATKNVNTEAVLSFEILKPLYARTYFIVLYLLVGLGLLYLLINLYDSTKLKFKMKKLETLSSTDPLTGINNRRKFQQNMADIWQQALAEHYYLCVLMMDIDFFKSYNDRYGHLAGDEALKQVAAEFRDCVQETAGQVCRYGGEEFTAVFTGTLPGQAGQIAEKIRSRIEALHICGARKSDKYLTVSVGGFEYIPQGDIPWQSFVEYADNQLYKAKQTGRNRVCIRYEL